MTKRRNTSRELAYLPTGSALAFLLLEIVGVARARNLRCASHFLNRDDASRLPFGSACARANTLLRQVHPLEYCLEARITV